MKDGYYRSHGLPVHRRARFFVPATVIYSSRAPPFNSARNTVVSTEGMPTGRTVETAFDMTVHLDVASIHFAKISTLDLIAPLVFEFHDVSPPRWG
jgi:hypothetical protein